ncbi:MAG TPA: penicillin-binding transpeptidase domain-containing protein, partial [Longimicrobiales bacterium]|nr:penicillin-binding transpeptidase domain-containing protein [Longimicrobiales bacterium]
PSTGAVLAWIGGRDFRRSEFDRVAQARRQVGSLVKPFLVAAALERGYGVIDPVSADTVPIETAQGPWMPADHVSETVLPLREALVRSSNRAAAHLGVELGLETIGEALRKAGLDGPVPAVPSSAIGAFDASLLEMTGAYAAFGNGGLGIEPYVLERIEAPGGRVVWSRRESTERDRVLDERTAFVVLDALRAVVDRGTGASVRARGYLGPAAGKTGTTNDGRDAWFVGLAPGLVAGVWIGFDRPGGIVSGRGGGALAAPVWASWMLGLSRGSELPDLGWVPPPGVEPVRYDPSTGEVLHPRCRRRPGADYEEAWVRSGSHEGRPCAGGVRGFLDRVWRLFVPDERARARPVRPGRSGLR